MSHRKQEPGFFEEILNTVNAAINKGVEGLLSDVGRLQQKQGELKSVGIETSPNKIQPEIEDHTQNSDSGNPLVSQIQEEIESRGQYPQDEDKENSHPVHGEIQQIIELYESHISSPTKSSRINKSALQEPTARTNRDKLLALEKEKIQVQEHLKKLQEGMREIKKEQHKHKLSKKHGDQGDHNNDANAAEEAQKMLSKIQKDKKQMQEKKSKQQLRLMEMLQKDAVQKEQKRREEAERIKQQKRDLILKKMEEKRAERDEKRMINKESNALISELKRSESATHHDQPISTLAQKKKTLQLKRDLSGRHQVNTKSVAIEGEKAQNDDSVLRAPKSEMRKEQSERYVAQYPKGRFLNIIEEEDKRKKDEEKQKEEGKKLALEKRMKYGQLIKNLFVPTKSRSQNPMPQSKMKPPTPEAPASSISRYSPPRKTQEPYLKRNHSKELNPRPEGSEKDSFVSELVSHEDRYRIDKEREERLKEHRRQTQLRLKKASEKNKEIEEDKLNLPKIRKYSNYLKDLPKAKVPNNDWKRILGDDRLTKEEKYAQVLSKAHLLQNKAKMSQQLSKGDDETMNLIIGSIQAKLALLDGL